MKTTSIILLAGLLLCGCSQKKMASQKDFIQTGRDITLNSGLCILHVDKRDGDLVSGIRCVMDSGKKTESVLTSDTGTLTTLVRKKDGQAMWMQLVLHNPNNQTAGKPQGG